jgi:hypothetical protein
MSALPHIAMCIEWKKRIFGTDPNLGSAKSFEFQAVDLGHQTK